MEFAIKKLAMIMIKNGKIESESQIKLPNQKGLVRLE